MGAVTTVYVYSGTKVIAEYEDGTLTKDYVERLSSAGLSVSFKRQ